MTSSVTENAYNIRNTWKMEMIAWKIELGAGVEIEKMELLGRDGRMEMLDFETTDNEIKTVGEAESIIQIHKKCSAV
jgi:hypothetical protein